MARRESDLDGEASKWRLHINVPGCGVGGRKEATRHAPRTFVRWRRGPSDAAPRDARPWPVPRLGHACRALGASTGRLRAGARCRVTRRSAGRPVFASVLGVRRAAGGTRARRSLAGSGGGDQVYVDAPIRGAIRAGRGRSDRGIRGGKG